ncbi:tRNA (guanosine(46)-N7)-methyltransferase TrmB [Persicirhabdus sediminis]|uniref:tRNA (guanine-N(7)-)-methyltransferase n=2 Tax=Persicirhabdus sediminis TaxID=454144 RepID=A0A8J7MGP0_9BACT|nr:tRNA (guanosine(46)-N7)-methyltransferase TrmB [Persicirhabdus sediminis]
MAKKPQTTSPLQFIPQDYFRRLSINEIFADDKPLEIDLGCGDGTFLLEMAKHYPERNFLGVERLLGRVRGVCKRAEDAKLTNVKVLRLESKYTLEWLLPEESVSRLHLLCPDPWPKAKHARRRLVQQDFLEALRKVLTPGGEFLFKTDHPPYFEWVEEEIETFSKFNQLEWPEDAFFYPKTDFQKLWESQGKSLQALRLQK